MQGLKCRDWEPKWCLPVPSSVFPFLWRKKTVLYHDGGRHPLLQGYREGMGCDRTLLYGKLNEAACQLPGKKRGVVTKGDMGGMLSADLPPF